MRVTPLFLLFIVFLILKLTSVIAWSWWWITAPLWIPLVAALSVWFLALIILSCVRGIVYLAEKR